MGAEEASLNVGVNLKRVQCWSVVRFSRVGAVFWYVTVYPCGGGLTSLIFEGSYCLCLRGHGIQEDRLTLKVKAGRSSETSGIEHVIS